MNWHNRNKDESSLFPLRHEGPSRQFSISNNVMEMILYISKGILASALMTLAACRAVPPAFQLLEPSKSYQSTSLQGPQCQRVPYIGFLEFSENGNPFDPYALDAIKRKITELNNDNIGVNVLTYVHGWHHNANGDDDDVAHFKQKVEQLGCQPGFDSRATIGVYVGWRGENINLPWHLNFWTYWDRKQASVNLGVRGFSQAIVELEEHAVVSSRRGPNGTSLNWFALIGHSFGTSVVLSGMLGILEEKTIGLAKCHGSLECLREHSFGHGIYLFNPAIEANALVSMRSYASGSQYHSNTPKLLHVMTTQRDWATRFIFTMGEWINTIRFLGYNKRDLNIITNNENCRSPANTDRAAACSFNESDLRVKTIGQFAPYWNGSLIFNEKKFLYQPIKRGCNSILLPESAGATVMRRYPGIREPGEAIPQECLDLLDKDDPQRTWQAHPIENHFRSNLDDPLQVTITDLNGDEFMKDHNAHLCSVPFAYIATGMMENQHQFDPASVPEFCRSTTIEGGFDFGQCFNTYIKSMSDPPSDPARCGTGQ